MLLRETLGLQGVISNRATIMREREKEKEKREKKGRGGGSTGPKLQNLQTAKSTHHPHKIDDQRRECKNGGGAFFAFFSGSDKFAHHPPKIPPDEEGLLWGWCVVRGPLNLSRNTKT